TVISSLSLHDALPISSALAADLKIRVVDPHSAAVPGAQVSVFAVGDATPIAITTTSAEGAASIAGLKNGSYRVQLLAPGFAARRSEEHTSELQSPDPL